MRERAAAVAVPGRPHVRDARAELVVDADVAPRVELDPGTIDVEVIGVRSPADGEEQMAAFDPPGVGDDGDSPGGSLDAGRLRVQTNVDLLNLEDALDLRGDVFVVARDEPPAALDDGHPRAEPAIHLRELEGDVASAEDDEMLRQRVDVHHRAVREERPAREARQIGDGRASADVHEDPFGLEEIVADAHDTRALEPRVTDDQLEVLRALHPRGEAVA